MKRAISSLVFLVVLSVTARVDAKRPKSKHGKAAATKTVKAPSVAAAPVAAPIVPAASPTSALAEGESIEEDVVFDDSERRGTLGALPEYKFSPWLLTLPLGLMFVFSGNVGWRRKVATKRPAMDLEADTIPVFVQQAKKRANKKAAQASQANASKDSGQAARAS